jgi:hypothetical protein
VPEWHHRLPKRRFCRLAALIRPDQKIWLESQAGDFRSIADVIRDLIDSEMQKAQEEINGN